MKEITAIPTKTFQTDLRREAFKAAGLSYQNIKAADIELLYLEINIACAGHEAMIMETRRPLKKDFKYSKDGGIIEGYIRVKGPYFDKREAISFNRDGFIGFAGWADKYNVQPFVQTFDKWILTLKK